MDVRFRSLTEAEYPSQLTPSYKRFSRSYFKAGLRSTLKLLEQELGRLKAHDIVIGVALRPEDIRLDGWPRADARVPSFPGVVLYFQSRHGPLRYATDLFAIWEHNLRAIALGLEALRQVDRYGIAAKGEQYTGWAALPAGEPTEFRTVEEAARFLVSISDTPNDPELAELIVSDGRIRHRVCRRIVARLHPDKGGDHDQFIRAINARRLIEEAA